MAHQLEKIHQIVLVRPQRVGGASAQLQFFDECVEVAEHVSADGRIALARVKPVTAGARKFREGVLVRSQARGLLETVRCVDGAAPFLARHQERLATSWSRWFTGAAIDLAAVAGSAIAATKRGRGLVRVACLVAVRGKSAEVSVTRRPLPPPPARWCVALAPKPRPEPKARRCHKQADRRGIEELTVTGANETLLWDDAHSLLEGTHSNLFVLVGSELITPPVAYGLVPGVVRAELCERAAAFKLTVTERTVTAADLVTCDALVLTGCGIGIVPVTECDGRPVGSPNGRARVQRLHVRLFPGG
ncbi:MAG: hypothetical protein EXS13_01105 [Planctomycetes bacterium]|nr:hypothetical protein [Planctomycetota bacterium]